MKLSAGGVSYWRPIRRPIYHGGRVGFTPGGDRVLRGGSWFDYARYLRSAYRYHNVPSYRFHFTGFRLARGL